MSGRYHERMPAARTVAALLIVVVAFAPPVAAQTAADTQPPAPPSTPIDPGVLKGMFPVHVVEKSGDEVDGKLISLTTTALVLQIEKPAPATRTFDLNDVAQVYRKGDSLKNGAIYGA